MANLILQHWSGEMGELQTLSSANIKEYAHRIGADYEMLRGDVFKPGVAFQLQKLCMLDRCWDNYDMVVMLDSDMFIRKGMTEDVFIDTTGVGMYASVQKGLHTVIISKFPDLASPYYPYWGGAIYRLDKKLRERFRAKLGDIPIERFNDRFHDEGVMHALAVRTKQPFSTIPDEYKWCHCSYREGIEEAAMIHIRTKVTPTGPKRSKVENYKELVFRGLI